MCLDKFFRISYVIWDFLNKSISVIQKASEIASKAPNDIDEIMLTKYEKKILLRTIKNVSWIS